ncbi:excisionase family DNA-binding protein [Rhizobium sp. AAP43]|uniref:excisionase family DNA-binding protein n=1 Tax=Rhizobium sp. AAP43 TaxID=1523420 RepID=UPI0006B9D3D9|nr:excisionase family DNA-binding protein [Rhizobium sp. AAP43]KPF47267.1 hypothetical protein IP76_00400 [Rhizobium sp. AAP43]
MNAYLTIREICEQTGFSRPFVAREMKRGNLSFVKIGRRVRVPKQRFYRWMRGMNADGVSVTPEPEPSLSDPMVSLQSRLDEVAVTLTGIASRMEERGRVLEGIGANLESLVTEIRSRRVKPGQVR